MIGLVTVDANGNRVVTWTALEGMGADNGALQVELTPEIMMAIQNGTALMAVVSK